MFWAVKEVQDEELLPLETIMSIYWYLNTVLQNKLMWSQSSRTLQNRAVRRSSVLDPPPTHSLYH